MNYKIGEYYKLEINIPYYYVIVAKIIKLHEEGIAIEVLADNDASQNSTGSIGIYVYNGYIKRAKKLTKEELPIAILEVMI